MTKEKRSAEVQKAEGPNNYGHEYIDEANYTRMDIGNNGLPSDNNKNISYPLSSREICFYTFIWATHAFLAFFIAAKSSNSAQKVGIWLDHWLEPSSYFNSIQMDNSDVEWKLFRMALPTAIACFIIHSVSIQIQSKISKEFSSFSMILLWLLLHIYWSSLNCILIIAIFTLISTTLITITRKQCLIWILALLFIAKMPGIAEFSKNPINYYREFNLYLYSAIKVLLLTNFKLFQVLNFCIYLLRNPQSRIDRNLLIQFTEYMLYPPYSMALIVLFEDFKEQRDLVNKCHGYTTTSDIIKFALRITFWFFILDFLLHICSVNALFNSEFTMLKNFNNYELASMAYVAGQLFHIKYVAIFGFPSLFAKIDGMTPPKPPICISRVSKYSQMWRQFDRGLYKFLKNQVYIPIINQPYWPIKNQAIRKFCAILTVFLFVLIWHGLDSNYFWWVSLSALELCIERVGMDVIWPSNVFQNRILSRLSEANFIRLKAFSMLFTVIPGIFGIFFFLGRPGVGDYIFQHVLIEGLTQILTLNIAMLNPGWVLLHLLLMGYAFNHVCLYLEFKETQNSLKSDDALTIKQQ